jgi:hypothetical protein
MATCLPAGPRLTGRFDIAMLPSLIRVENLVAALAGYEVVLVDECDHVPATSFEMVLRACPIRRVYVRGEHATPKDHWLPDMDSNRELLKRIPRFQKESRRGT